MASRITTTMRPVYTVEIGGKRRKFHTVGAAWYALAKSAVGAKYLGAMTMVLGATDVERTRAAAGRPSPTCCVKGCTATVDHEGDICQPHVDEIDRRLATLAEEDGIPVERVYAKLGAYCDEQAKRRARA